MSAGFMSTMLKHWRVTSACHRLIRTSSADTSVSPSQLVETEWMLNS